MLFTITPLLAINFFSKILGDSFIKFNLDITDSASPLSLKLFGSQVRTVDDELLLFFFFVVWLTDDRCLALF